MFKTLPFIFLLTVSPSLYAADVRVVLPDRSVLVFDVPADWSFEKTANRKDQPAEIRYTSRDRAFEVLITPIWRENLGVPVPTRFDVKARVRVAADAAIAHTVERDLPLREFSDSRVYGSYFVATDRAPAPGGFKYLAQGMAALGEIRIAFTLVSNEEGASLMESTLGVVQGVRRVAGADGGH